MIYLQLFYEFFKTGLFAVGGGMATIPFLYEMSNKTGWFTHTDLANIIAVSESTPGPIGVNMATYVGYITGMQQGGVFNALLGAVTATLGLVTPSVIVILIVSAILSSFRNSTAVNNTFYGLRPASTGLIASAGISVVLTALFSVDTWNAGSYLSAFNWKGIILAVVLFIATNYIPKIKKLHPIMFIGFSAVIGILLQMK